MAETDGGFVSRSFLRSVWASDYAAFQGSAAETELLARLQRWAARTDLKETSAEAAFIEEFFRATWGYAQTGQAGTEAGFTLWPQFKVPGAGASGGPGQADLAIGWFTGGAHPVPQALCEFKSIRSALDADQKRKGSTRSPVRQCLDYLSHARKGMMGSEPVVPLWAVVSDMNEFRLYWYDRGHQQAVRFVIQPRDLFQGEGMLAGTEAARFDRFLFSRLFHRDVLTARIGRPPLLDLIAQRRFRDKEIENAFYAEYRAFRDHLYTELLARNGEGTGRFPGTRGRLVRLAQKVLDRLLFVFFCEDMGQVLAFPPKLLQDFLVTRSSDPYFSPDGTGIWQDLLALFRSMDAGTHFGGKAIHRFNGGLFAPDPLLEQLHVPNLLFCVQGQGQGEEALRAHKLTVLYLCATYNYAADLGEAGQQGDGMGGEQRSLGLYTLGRIFEQSITELEILEAEAEGRPSVNLASQRKRDGVYYTPEWVVERVVDGTLAPCLARIRTECGWPAESADDPPLAAVDAYLERLRSFTVLDPACGSGAFLITAMRYLAGEWKRTLAVRRRSSPVGAPEPHEAAIVADILRSNIYGVDINPASVEIAQLALWLHTARGDRPLSSLDHTVRTGNTLVTDDFYRGVQLGLYDDAGKERVNAFDWRAAFPEVAARGGFDAVVGNPPYVKLQNFRPAQPDVAEYLVRGRPGVVAPPFRSTRTGNFDLYLPFIEQGLRMLNPEGRLGYIAPSLWTVNEYGEGLRQAVAAGRSLDRWLDFRSFQVFEEATTYTALQFFSRAPTAAVCVAQAPTGTVPPDPWADAGRALDWDQVAFGERWLLLTGEERALVDRLAATSKRLDDPAHTTNLFVGVQTSADAVYHLRRVGPGRYLCSPAGNPKPPPYEVEIEDAVMRPLVSGAEAKRYVEPRTNTWVLFPYRDGPDGVEPIPPNSFGVSYPKAWAHLWFHKSTLEMREAKRARDGTLTGPVYDEQWYRYVYAKNLDKQHLPKLVVPRLVAHLACAVDATGAVCLDNVDVGGVLVADGEDPWFLAGILNAPVADFVFRRISKPFRGDYLSANKQFIAPLPIPPATPEERAAVAADARNLQVLHTRRRDLLAHLARRLDATACRPLPETWLFPGLRPARDRIAEAPSTLDAAGRRTWAKQQYDADLSARLSAITPRLRPGAVLDAALRDGELVFSVDSVPVVDRVFVSEAEGAFLLAQWKVVASTFSITERTDGRALAKALRTLVPAGNAPLMDQIVAFAADLSACEASIATAEAAMDDRVFALYRLTSAERAMVERG